MLGFRDVDVIILWAIFSKALMASTSLFEW